MRQGEDGWQLWVEAADAERAAFALDSYDRENAERARPAPRLIEHGPSQAGFITALGLLLFYAFVNDSNSIWYLRGSASASAILGGELWRSVTALTLHADLPHVFGNAASCAVFATLLCRWIGAGAGLSLTLLAGIAGNLLNAWSQTRPHVSIGASTALFGTIGVLSGLAFVHRSQFPLRRGRAWLPLAGGLGLLAMLGTGGDRTDVGAHLYGLASGAVIGIAWGYAVPRSPGGRIQVTLCVVSFGALCLAWSLALG